MHKDELLDLHEEMAIIKEYFEQQADTPDDLFEEYESLGVGPTDVHKSKSEHRHAIFVLGEALATKMSDGEFSEGDRLANRMREFADDISQKL